MPRIRTNLTAITEYSHYDVIKDEYDHPSPKADTEPLRNHNRRYRNYLKASSLIRGATRLVVPRLHRHFAAEFLQRSWHSYYRTKYIFASLPRGYSYSRNDSLADMVLLVAIECREDLSRSVSIGMIEDIDRIHVVNSRKATSIARYSTISPERLVSPSASGP